MSNHYVENQGRKIRTSHFPMSMFGITLETFLLISGVHVGLIVGMMKIGVNDLTQVICVISYWFVVAFGFTLWVRKQMKKAYEEPLQAMAEATAKVANGDFSVYVPPIHTADDLDYLDVMIMNFNKMVEELGSIETLKTDFLSNVSHEIKTPIAVIMNSAEMLQAASLTEEEHKEYLQTIIQSSKKLSELITNILKMNKLEKQSIQMNITEFDLCSQLCNCALIFEQLWDKRGIEFEAELEDECHFYGDESLLELVWMNLLSNAFKFTQEGGRVFMKQHTGITKDTGEKRVFVEIIDTGCGMDENTRRHIFDKFYQGDTSHSTEGNGLGLALVVRIIDLMDGKIEVESILGEGTTFKVSLPMNE